MRHAMIPSGPWTIPPFFGREMWRKYIPGDGGQFSVVYLNTARSWTFMCYTRSVSWCLPTHLLLLGIQVALTEGSICGRNCAKPFIFCYLRLNNTPTRHALSCPFFRLGNLDSTRWSYLHKVTSLETVNVRIQMQAKSRTRALPDDTLILLYRNFTHPHPWGHVYNLSLGQLIAPVVGPVLKEWPFIV